MSPPPRGKLQRNECRCFVTGDIDRVGAFRAEDDAGHQDESSDQQKGEKIEQHQESQQHEEGLDSAAKVSCGTKGLSNNRRWAEEAAFTCRRTCDQLQRFSPRGEQIEELSGAHFQSTQEFAPLSFPRLPFGNRRRPHLLHLPAMERKTSGKRESGMLESVPASQQVKQEFPRTRTTELSSETRTEVDPGGPEDPPRPPEVPPPSPTEGISDWTLVRKAAGRRGNHRPPLLK